MMKQNRLAHYCLRATVALSLLGLIACTPLIQPPAESPDQGAAEETPTLVMARANLAQTLGVAPDAISVVAEEAVEWPDACLGAPQTDEMCAQVITPGFQVTLAADGQEYLYHTNADGSQLRLVTEAAAANAGASDQATTYFVESVEVRVLETDPVQVEAVVRGQLADACTTIADATVAQQGSTFVITLQTSRPADKMCAQLLTPFEQVVALGTPDPATGSYEVQAGEVVESFTLGD